MYVYPHLRKGERPEVHINHINFPHEMQISGQYPERPVVKDRLKVAIRRFSETKYILESPGSITGTTRKKVVGLEPGALSLVSTTEELLDRKVAAPVYKTENIAVEIRHADHVASSICKNLAITSPTSGGRSVGIVRSRDSDHIV
jgi:hypothetical protein